MNERKIQWTHFSEFIATIAVFLVCFSWLGSRLDRQAERTDRLYGLYATEMKEMNRKIDQHRTEIAQQLSDYRKESDQRFYDLLREGRNK